MRAVLSERNLVVILFVMVFITFAFAHEDSKKMEQGYIGANKFTSSQFFAHQTGLKTPAINNGFSTDTPR